jgi:dUTP pyrophosphatase
MTTQNTITVKISRSDIEAPSYAPEYATSGAGAFDIRSIEDTELSYGCPVIVKTGLKLEIPPGHAMLLFSRSGHGFKENVRLANSVGVIDSDYRGELMVKLTMDFPSWQNSLQIKSGDRIAQGIVIPVPRVEFVEITSLSHTERGEGGFGSTGVL